MNRKNGTVYTSDFIDFLSEEFSGDLDEEASTLIEAIVQGKMTPAAEPGRSGDTEEVKKKSNIRINFQLYATREEEYRRNQRQQLKLRKQNLRLQELKLRAIQIEQDQKQKKFNKEKMRSERKINRLYEKVMSKKNLQQNKTPYTDRQRLITEMLENFNKRKSST